MQKKIHGINVRLGGPIHRAKSCVGVIKAKDHLGDEPRLIWPTDSYFQLWSACSASSGPSLLGVTQQSRTKPSIANTIKSMGTPLMSVDTSTIWWKTWKELVGSLSMSRRVSSQLLGVLSRPWLAWSCQGEHRKLFMSFKEDLLINVGNQSVVVE